MNPVVPQIPEGFHLITFAKNQKEYLPLPAAVNNEGTVVTEWELTAEELELVFIGGLLRLTIKYTGVHRNEPLTPLMLEVVEPACGFEDPSITP